MPPELRNNIYEFVYTRDTSKDVKVDLRTATPPSSALLLSCRQINSEARSPYRSSYRKFWTETSFVLEAACAETIHKNISRIHGEDLDHVMSLHISLPGVSGPLRSEVAYDLVRKNLWSLTKTYMTRNGGDSYLFQHWTDLFG